VAHSRFGRVWVAAALDLLILVIGLIVALPFVVSWAVGRSGFDPIDAIAVALVVVMSRFPLVLTHRSGDIVIGFETCVLVFLVLTVAPAEAFALWAVGTALANATQAKSWRSRAFNVGLTILGGGLFVLVVGLLDPGPDQRVLQLVAVMTGCAVYFAFDLIVTATSLAIEDGCSLGTVLRWSSVPLGLACFVSVDTLGYLAALLRENQPTWTLLLLLVPVATILVAVRSVSDARLAHLRLVGLLEAATHAPDWSDEDHIERSLLVQAERTLRHTVATFRDGPPVTGEIGAPVLVSGRPPRHLVVTHQSSGREFDDHDRAALEALIAVGVSAFNRRRLSDEMSYLARHDALTGLHNRGVFTDRLTQALERRPAEGFVAILFVDLDGFKEVNDLLGHGAGDRLLVMVANRILGCLREGDTAARLGGDEFGILLDDLTGDDQADLVAGRLLTALEAPFDADGTELRVRASIGIAFSGPEPATAEVLINSADTAMYAAKAQGKGRSVRFHPEMRAAELDRLELEAALREAVRDGQISVSYQPVIDLGSGRVDGFEALARWTHPALGSVPPDQFIPAAERLGLIRELGLQILDKAHEGGRALSQEAGRALTLGVNLSALQVTDPDLADRVAVLAERHGEVRLVLELTEGVLLGDDVPTVAALHRLKACGVRLAIDDFGVGYSSVGYLHRLPLDLLKIDKVFVNELHDARSHALVQGVVSMARAMDLTVVIEGVEDWHSAMAVRELGCDLAQGYVFSRPLSLEAALELAAQGSVDLTALSLVPRPRTAPVPSAGVRARGLVAAGSPRRASTA
jgi:diguanylate cyclase (GGDEF)-like protein